MSILADRRRKAKWTLNPGRQALWNKANSDGIKFGQGLMEKMGWQIGQGLGVNKQGIKEPLKIAVKNDSKGMGFKDSDNEWIQQQHDFSELLGKLSSSNHKVNKNQCSAPKTDRIRTSLEEKSRHSKTRVHYHKFTRGKDLTKYSEKDLECILGTKKESPNDVSDHKGADSFSELEKISSIVHAGSMVDYFRQKMLKKNAAAGTIGPLNLDNMEEGVATKCNDDFAEAEHMRFGKKKKKTRKKENEAESCNILIRRKIEDQTSVDECHGEMANAINRSVDNERQQISLEKEVLNAAKIEDFSRNSNDERGVKENNGKANICSEKISPDDIEYKHLKIGKKERRKKKLTEEYNLCCVDQLENKEVIWKKQEIHENVVEHPHEVSSPRKKARKKERENAVIADARIKFERQPKKKESDRKVAEDDKIERDVIVAMRKRAKGGNNDDRIGSSEICQPKVNCERGESHKESVKKENHGKEILNCESALCYTELLKSGRAVEKGNTSKIISWANADKFHGSNLREIKGYGTVRDKR